MLSLRDSDIDFDQVSACPAIANTSDGTALLSTGHALALTDQAIVTGSVLNMLLVLNAPAS